METCWNTTCVTVLFYGPVCLPNISRSNDYQQASLVCTEGKHIKNLGLIDPEIFRLAEKNLFLAFELLDEHYFNDFILASMALTWF